jgi:hypothetical protein
VLCYRRGSGLRVSGVVPVSRLDLAFLFPATKSKLVVRLSSFRIFC